jgi:hypothetical protein
MIRTLSITFLLAFVVAVTVTSCHAHCDPDHWYQYAEDETIASIAPVARWVDDDGDEWRWLADPMTTKPVEWCRTCRFLDVPLDSDGVRRPRATHTYNCLAEIPVVALPASVRNYTPPKPGRVEPRDGGGCAYHRLRQNPNVVKGRKS